MAHMSSTLVPNFLLILALASMLLVGCTAGPAAPPSSSTAATESASPTPGAGGSEPAGLAPGESWLVQGANAYVDGTSPVCADEDLLSNPDSEFPGVYLEQGPGMPDSWKPGDEYQVNGDGILLDFGSGDYSGSRFDGDDFTGIGTAWETFGTFTFERDDEGVITGGSGTGKTRILHENGDVENLTDSMTFTVSIVDEPTWCTIPVGE